MANGNLQFGDIIIIGESIPGVGMEYLAAESGTDVNINRKEARQWEHFMIINAKYPASRGLVYHNDEVALLGYHGNFLSHNGTNVIQEGGIIEDKKIWSISNDFTGNDVEITCTNVANHQQGFINLKASNGDYINRNSTGNAILQNDRQKLYYKIDDEYRQHFNVPRHNQIKFINPCLNTVTLPSKYGPIDVCEYGRHELLVLDLRGIINDPGYFVELSRTKPLIWQRTPILFPNGTTGDLINGSWHGLTEKIPEYLVINDLLPQKWFGECIPSSDYIASAGEFYTIVIATGNPWLSSHINFRIK